MKLRKLLGVFLSLSLAMPSTAAVTTTGTVTGRVSMSGRGLDGMSIVLVNLETGKSFAVKTSTDGAFTAALPAGSYVVSTPGRGGVAISRAPLSIEIASGKVATANVELANLALQTTTSATGSANIKHDAADCITEGEFTLIEAIFEPLSAVVNGRLYFQSNLSPEWFYTEFEKIDPQVAGGPSHRAFIPKVNKDGGIETITYYLQVTSSDFAETKSPEHKVKVVSEASECEGKMAPVGTPDGAVSVLSAQGTAASALAGFGGIAGAGIGVGLLIVGGVVLIAGGVAVRQATQDDPTPTPTPASTPTATPAATPTATPALTCALTVTTAPDVPADESTGPGRFCTASVQANGVTIGNVSGRQVFTLACSSRVVIFASARPANSSAPVLPAEFSGACSGGLGSPCVIDPLGANRAVDLVCQTR